MRIICFFMKIYTNGILKKKCASERHLIISVIDKIFKEEINSSHIYSVYSILKYVRKHKIITLTQQNYLNRISINGR